MDPQTKQDHAAASEIFIQDEANTNWHNETLWFVRSKRDKAAQSVPEWEALQACGTSPKSWLRGTYQA